MYWIFLNKTNAFNFWLNHSQSLPIYAFHLTLKAKKMKEKSAWPLIMRSRTFFTPCLLHASNIHSDVNIMRFYILPKYLPDNQFFFCFQFEEFSCSILKCRFRFHQYLIHEKHFRLFILPRFFSESIFHFGISKQSVSPIFLFITAREAQKERNKKEFCNTDN